MVDSASVRFENASVSKNVFKHLYTVGNRLRVGVRAKTLACQGLRVGPSKLTTGIFSKVLPVQIGGVLRCKLEVYCGVSLSSRLRSQRGTALQMGGVLRYKLEVYCQYFLRQVGRAGGY